MVNLVDKVFNRLVNVVQCQLKINKLGVLMKSRGSHKISQKFSSALPPLIRHERVYSSKGRFSMSLIPP